MSSKKPLEQIIEDEKSLQLLEFISYYFQYAENVRTELEELTIKLRDIIIEPYTCNGGYDADYKLICRLDRVILGKDTKEDLVEFIKKRQDKHD